MSKAVICVAKKSPGARIRARRLLKATEGSRRQSPGGWSRDAAGETRSCAHPGPKKLKTRRGPLGKGVITETPRGDKAGRRKAGRSPEGPPVWAGQKLPARPCRLREAGQGLKEP